MAGDAAPAAPLARPRIAPSILSADFARLGAQVAAIMDAGARVIHVDVMDGSFVPPITVGPLVVHALAEAVTGAGGTLDVHLMVDRPERQVDEFARAGADTISIHQEATPHVHRTLGMVREAGCRAGLAICPATPPEVVAEVADLLDVALCMTVNPGWGGQAFIPASIDRIGRLRSLLADRAEIEVDGGVDARTAGPCARAGARVLVAGSAVFGAPDPAAAYRRLAAAVEAEVAGEAD